SPRPAGLAAARGTRTRTRADRMLPASAQPIAAPDLRTSWTNRSADRGTVAERERPRLAELAALEELGDERGDRGALRAGEGDVAEQAVALQRLDHAGDAVV